MERPPVARIDSAINEIAAMFGAPAQDTIVLNNMGNHRFEIGLMLAALSPGDRLLDVGGGMGVNLLCLKRLFPDLAEAVLIEAARQGLRHGLAATLAIGEKRVGFLCPQHVLLSHIPKYPERRFGELVAAEPEDSNNQHRDDRIYQEKITHGKDDN